MRAAVLVIRLRALGRSVAMRTSEIVLLSILIVVSFTGNAYAYLDPGTGSLIVQGIIAAVGAILLAGRMYWARIKGLFGRTNSLETSSSDSPVRRQHRSSQD